MDSGATAQSSDPTAADATNGGDAGDTSSDIEDGTQVGDNPLADGNDQPATEGGVDPRNLCPTVEMLLEEDVGLEVSNDAFNAAHGLKSFHVEYRVIELDPQLQNLVAADKKLLAVYVLILTAA